MAFNKTSPEVVQQANSWFENAKQAYLKQLAEIKKNFDTVTLSNCTAIPYSQLAYVQQTQVMQQINAAEKQINSEISKLS